MMKKHANKSLLTTTTICSVVAMICLSLTPAQAKWLHRKTDPAKQVEEKVRTFQPPPPDSITRYCEPYRAEVVKLGQKPFLLRPFYAPRRWFLMSKYEKCRERFMSQEHIYLKHADIEQAPSLPKMNVDSSKPGAPNGNLP